MRFWLIQWNYDTYLIVAPTAGEALKELLGGNLDIEHEDDKISIKEYSPKKAKVVAGPDGLDLYF